MARVDSRLRGNDRSVKAMSYEKISRSTWPR